MCNKSGETKRQLEKFQEIKKEAESNEVFLVVYAAEKTSVIAFSL